MSFFTDMLRNITNGDHGRRGHGSSHGSSHRDRDSGYRPDGYATRSGSCPACQMPLASGARFCPQCGTAVTPKVCGGCSTTLADGARFCASCGKPAV